MSAAPDTIPALFDGFLKSVSSPVEAAAVKVLPGAVPPPQQIMVTQAGAASTTGTCVTTKKTMTFMKKHGLIIAVFVLILVVGIALFVRAQIKKKAKQREESEKKEDEYASFFKTEDASKKAVKQPVTPGLVMPPASLLQPPQPFAQHPVQQQQPPVPQQFQPKPQPQFQQPPQQQPQFQQPPQQQPQFQQPAVRAQAPVQPPAQKFDAVISLDSVPTSAGGSSPSAAAINGVEQSGKRGRLEKESTIPASDVGSAPPSSKDAPPPAAAKPSGADPNFSAL